MCPSRRHSKLYRRIRHSLLTATPCVRILLIILCIQCFMLWNGNSSSLLSESSWVSKKWIDLKNWWLQTDALQQKEPSYKSWTREEMEQYWDENDQSDVVDFEYSFPPPDNNYAYVWYANGPAQICSALTAMTMLSELRRNSSERSSNTDFLLIFLYTKEPSGSDAEYQASEMLVTKWEELGGQAEGVQIKKPEIRDNRLARYNRVKYHILKIQGYSKFLLLTPEGIPLKSMDHLFYNAFSPMAAVLAPLANQKEILLAETNVEKMQCFGSRAPVVSTNVMVLSSGYGIEERLNQYLLRTKGDSWTDLQAINHEFFCNDEITALPKKYDEADTSFRKDKRFINLSDTYFVHFDLKLKPWHDRYFDRVLPKLREDLVEVILDWRRRTEQLCSFFGQKDWFEDAP